MFQVSLAPRRRRTILISETGPGRADHRDARFSIPDSSGLGSPVFMEPGASGSVAVMKVLEEDPVRPLRKCRQSGGIPAHPTGDFVENSHGTRAKRV